MTLTASASVFLSAAPVLVSEPRPNLWVVRHDNPVRQIVLDRGVPLPEVFPLMPNGYMPLNFEWQKFWKGINPDLEPRDWRAMLYFKVAFTNGQGFEKPNDPRADYVNGKDIGAALPKMELLLCGGAVVTGMPEGAWLYVDTLDGWADPPSPKWAIAHPWYWFAAVSINPRGEIHNLHYGGQDLVKRVPIVSRFPVRYPLAGLRRLRDDEPIPSVYA